jgi:glycosyltransferase involved in cell wall biosynthesis
MSATGREPLRIVHAIARLNVGGAALHVLELAAEQQRRGDEVLVVAGRLEPGEESMAYVAAELGVPVRPLPELQRALSLRRDAAAIRALRSILAERRPQVLHTHAAKAGATGRIAARLAGGGRPRTVVHTFHGHVLSGYFSPRRERVFRVLERLLARRTGALVAVSEEVRDELVALGVASVHRFAIVPYGFDLDRRVDADAAGREIARTELGAEDGAFLVGYTGRLTAIKRPLDLVRTLHALVDREGVDARLALVGDGEDRAAVEALAAKLDLTERVRFLGYRTDVAPLLAAFDALLLTSANEGTPVSAIEALAAGRPVVATRVGGVPHVVDDGETGVLAEAGDVDALAAGLARLARDPAERERMGRVGAERVRARFGVGRMVDDLDVLYRRLLAAS